MVCFPAGAKVFNGVVEVSVWNRDISLEGLFCMTECDDSSSRQGTVCLSYGLSVTPDV